MTLQTDLRLAHFSVQERINDMSELIQIGTLAKKAAGYLALQDSAFKNSLLKAIADELRKNAQYIEEENKKDLSCAKANGISDAMQDRLRFDTARVNSCADGVEKVILKR